MPVKHALIMRMNVEIKNLMLIVEHPAALSMLAFVQRKFAIISVTI